MSALLNRTPDVSHVNHFLLCVVLCEKVPKGICTQEREMLD